MIKTRTCLFALCCLLWSVVLHAAPVWVTDSLPEVNDDVAYTSRAKTILINVLQNDKFSEYDFPEVVTQPAFGRADFVETGQIFFTPNEYFCGVDQFRYRICNLSGCDVATVSIKVNCDKLKVFTGFSPNGDGVNDVFRIDGLDLYEKNELMVYNRWGNLVYEAVSYQNDWNGTFNGTDLPDGTYFYVLKTDHELTKGSVVIRR